MLTALVAAALLAPAWSPGLRAADAYADGRRGTVSFAVRTEKELWGRHLDRPVQSASVVKALLLVAYLRQPGVRSRRLRRDERHLLSPMIRWSSNLHASRVVEQLGAARINRVARTAGMPSFRLDAFWGRSSITARGQTRFFLHIDRLVPRRHRAFAMKLLRTVVHPQRWGIGEVIPRGWTAYFKGGWGDGRDLVDHQVALLTRGRERVAVAVLTTVAGGGHAEGKRTLRAVFRRLLRGLARSRPAAASVVGRLSAALRARLQGGNERGLVGLLRLVFQEPLGRAPAPQVA